jgi:hypothetical protein
MDIGTVVKYEDGRYVYLGQTVEHRTGDMTYNGDAMLLPLNIATTGKDKPFLTEREYNIAVVNVNVAGKLKLPFEELPDFRKFKVRKENIWFFERVPQDGLKPSSTFN